MWWTEYKTKQLDKARRKRVVEDSEYLTRLKNTAGSVTNLSVSFIGRANILSLSEVNAVLHSELRRLTK